MQYNNLISKSDLNISEHHSVFVKFNVQYGVREQTTVNYCWPLDGAVKQSMTVLCKQTYKKWDRDDILFEANG